MRPQIEFTLSGQLVNPIGGRGSNRAECAEVVNQGLKVDAAVEFRCRDCGKGTEVVTSIGKEVVHRHDVIRAQIKSDTVQHDIGHRHRCAVARHDGLGEIIGEAFRDTQVQERAARAGWLALFLEHGDDLGASHRECLKRIVEGLEGEGLAVGYDTITLWGIL